MDVSFRSFLCAIENGHTGALGVVHSLVPFLLHESARALLACYRKDARNERMLASALSSREGFRVYSNERI